MARPGRPTPPTARPPAARESSPGPGRGPDDGRGGPPDGPPEGRARASAQEAAREAAKRSLLFSLLLLGALLAARLPQPWAAVGLLFTVAALVVGGLALAASLRARRRGSAAVLSAGLALALLVLLAQSAALLLWPLQGSLRDCMAGAVTAQSRSACQDEFADRAATWVEQLGASGTRG